MPSAIALFDQLAHEYESSFYDPPHRKAYDQLAWEHVRKLLPPSPGTIIEAGCGSGHWVQRLLPLGYDVVGIEQSTEMINVLQRKSFGERFTLVKSDMEEAELGYCSADLVLAMGSLQYTRDPVAAMSRLVSWIRPGGTVCVLVDSYVALVLELLRAGKVEEALERARTGRGLWTQGSVSAELSLFTRHELTDLLRNAGLSSVTCKGLLVSASALGVQACTQVLKDDGERLLQLERAMAALPRLADAGKQLLAYGIRA